MKVYVVKLMYICLELSIQVGIMYSFLVTSSIFFAGRWGKLNK